MAVFAKSVFQSVLDRLEDEAPAAEEETSGGPMVRGLKAGFVAESWTEIGDDPVDARSMGSAYADFAAEPVAPAAPVLPDWIDRLSEAEVAADLGLADGDDAATIQDKRRAFARANHPDLFDPAFASQATARMMTANMLCDRAVKALASRRS